MDTAKRVAKNTIYLSFVRILNPMVSLILVIIIARFKDVSFLGSYSVILAFFSIFEMISSLGLETLIVRDVSKDKSKASKYMINSFVLMFLSGLFCALIMCGSANVFGYEKKIIVALYIASFALIPNSFAVVWRGLFKAFEKNVYITLTSFLTNVFRVGFSVAIIYLGFDLLGLMTVFLGASLLGVFVALYFIRKKIIYKIEFETDFEFCKKILKSTLTFMMISIVVSFYWQVGIIILSKVEGPTAVGIFSASFRLFNTITGFIIAFGVSVFPLISQRYEMSASKFKSISINSARYIIIVILFITVLTTFLSEDIIQLFYGIKFKESAAVLRVLIWATVPFSLVTVFAYSLFSSNNQKIDLAINSVGLASNVFLNLLLVPRFSYLGTSIAAVASTCILLICQYIFINRNLFRLKLTKILTAPCLSSAIMVSFIILLRSKVNLYILLLGSTFLYFIALYLLKAFDENEKDYMRKAYYSFLHSWKFSRSR